MKTTGIIIGSLTTAILLSSLCSCVSFGNIYDHADEYTAGDVEISEKIGNLDIDWQAGSVNVSRYDGSTISVTETCGVELSEERQVHTWVDGKTLRIKYCKSGESFTLTNSEKKLEIKLPKDYDLTLINYDGASCSATFDNICADTFDVDTASGGVIFKDCTADKFDLDTASGDIELAQKGETSKLTVDTASGDVKVTGETIKDISTDAASGKVKIDVKEIEKLDSDAASGNVELRSETVPRETNVDTSSGDIELYFPKNADLTVDFDTASGDFNSDFSFSEKSGKKISGSGSNTVSVDTASGDLTINAIV